jgi:recombination protein RecA
MKLTDKQRSELLLRIKAGFKSYKLEDDNLPMSWADRVDVVIPVVPTPSARLNAALGIGGIPLGRITEIYGTEQAGKTTLMLELIAKAQQMGLPCGFVDMEHGLDASYAQALGVDMQDLLISQPTTGDNALQVIKVLIESGMKVVVLDSIPALVSEDEYGKDITEHNMALQARMMGQAMRQLAPLASRAGCALIFINQIREKIGIVYGNPETTPGGRAIKFFASIRLDLRATSKRDDQRRTSKITVVKNKLAPPFRNCEVDIVYGKGFDKVNDAIQFARDLTIISGRSWMTLPKLKCEGLKDKKDDLKFQGLDAVRGFIEMTPGYLDALMDECQKAFKANNGNIPVPEGEENE